MAQHVVDLENLGMPADNASAANQGARDCSPVWNATIPGLKEGDTLLLPPHYCAFKLPLLPLPNSVELIGAGGGSHMVRCFSQGPSDFFLRMGSVDSTVRGVRIWAADGTEGGMALGRHAVNGEEMMHPVIEHVEITRFNTGRFQEGIHIDGQLSAPMYGARRAQIEDVIISGVTWCAMWLGALNSSSISDVTLGAGSPQLSLFCVGVTGNPCNQLDIDGTIDGTVIFYSTLASKLDAASLEWAVTDNNCVGVKITAAYLNKEPPLLLGTNCFLEANGKRWKSSPSGAVST